MKFSGRVVNSKRFVKVGPTEEENVSKTGCLSYIFIYTARPVTKLMSDSPLKRKNSPIDFCHLITVTQLNSKFYA